MTASKSGPQRFLKSLDPRKVRWIRWQRSKGVSVKVLAAYMDVVPKTIRELLKGETWGHVKNIIEVDHEFRGMLPDGMTNDNPTYAEWVEQQTKGKL